MLCKFYCTLRRVSIRGWPVRERIELPHLILRTGHRMYHITGFDREEIIDLCIRINSAERGTGASNWPPCLGLFKSVVATLTYMRHNRTQAEIGESLGVSQPTISRSIAAVTPSFPKRCTNSSRCRRPQPGCPVHPGRHTAPVLVMGRAQGIVLGKAQDHRNERPGRLHDLRQARLDF